jgi:hypothetical protein
VKRIVPPTGAGKDSITAMPRGPQSVYIHWRLDGLRCDDIEGEFPGESVQWVLRSLDMTADTNSTLDLPNRVGSMYLAVEPGHTYGFEIAGQVGVRWRTVCTTPPIEVPRARPADARADAAVPPELDVPGLQFETTPLPGGASEALLERDA